MSEIEKIVSVLEVLNHDDDEQWTSEGLPRIEVVSDLLGEKVTRSEISEAAPGFKKGTTLEYEDEEDEEDEEDGGDSEEDTDVTGDVGVLAEATEPEEVPIEQLTEEMELVAKELDKLNLELDIAKRRQSAMQDRYDRLITRRDVHQDKIKAAEAIKHYQQSQQEQRRLRVEEHGVPKQPRKHRGERTPWPLITGD